MMYTCPSCGNEHNKPHDIDVMTDDGWDVQQNGCEECWIETMCRRYPLIPDTETIERMDRYDPMP